MTKAKARLIRFLIFGSLALLASGAYVFFSADETPRTHTHHLNVAGVEIGGPFTLVKHTGETVTDKDFQDTYKLIYFGFTYCPAVCPTELQKMTAALKDLGALQDKITPILISVDPGRDTPEVLREYVDFFHPKLIGLTGTQAQIDTVLKSYKVYAAKVEDEEATDYTMDHSSFIYFMAPDDTLLKIFRTQDTAAYITTEIEKILESREQS